MSGFHLTGKQRRAFEQDGVVVLRDVVDAHWREELEAAVERDIADPGPFFNGYRTEAGYFHGNLRIWENDDGFRRFCVHGPLRAVAGDLLGASALTLFYDQLFVKEPRTPQPTRWHNDQPYWPVRGWPVMSFWIPLDPVTRESGGLEFVAGSHLWGRWFQPEPFAEGAPAYEAGEDYEPMPDIDSERGRYRIVGWDMDPGDVLAFHALTIHGAGGNLTEGTRRRGYAVRYCGEECRYFAGPGPNAGLRNPELSDGVPLESTQYPVVWQVGV